ncbi:putative transposase, partial [Breznakia sp. PFB2-8]|nr:putative transposase [Breznakia sp. PFB2-8]MDF9861018.1 putative transposase [Breznakia sp. PH5-24]
MCEIINIYYEFRCEYGYRRITDELNIRGYEINHKKVKRLMSIMGLYSKLIKKNKYKSYRGDVGKKADNIIERNFEADGPNKKWTTDVTEFKTPEGKLYLSPILDMYNSEIISYNISSSPNYNQITDMLDQAFEKHDDLEGLILHSDQGWQYQMDNYHKRLKEKGIIQSMSRKGNCIDNSIMESFFGVLKKG